MKHFKLALIFLLVFFILSACSLQESTNKTAGFDTNSSVNEQPSNMQTTEQVIQNIEKKDYYVPEPIGDTFEATVVRVIDGDTVEIELPSGKKETVRLLLIDTPESVHPTKPVQPFGKEASDFAKEFFKAGETIEVDLDVSERDKYGRLLAYLWKDGILYQDVVLEKGLARVAYVYPPNVAYVDYFRKNEAIAKQKQVGIWSIENYVTESGFNDDLNDIQLNGNNPPGSQSNVSFDIPDANGDGVCNDIKGNIGSNGKIYHLPGGEYYEKTKAEQYFCTEQEALDAGFRKSKR